MGIMIYRDREAASAAAATLIAAQMIEKPDCVLGLSASEMAGTVYRQLCGITAAGVLDWGEVTVFHTSEFLSRRAGQPGAQSAYLSRLLYQHVGLSGERIHTPNHIAPDMQAACSAYEAELVATRGMDLLVLYLGRNGHLAFNGPAREFSAFTHVELLPQNTMEECAGLTGTDGAISQAVTMGVSTIMSAKRILMLAIGRDVAGIASRMLSAAVTPAVPASLLQLHPSVTYVLDEEAASNL